MTEAELRKKIKENQTKYSAANDSAKALIMAENESLASQLDKLTGGISTYDSGTGLWNLSASKQGAIDRYLDQREFVSGSAYAGYDPETDPAYSALRKQYLREADRGVEDTMGAYAGMTGGIPSTAAVTAAQQAGDYYRGQLADRQVELGEQDYSRYLADLDNQRDLLNLYASEAQNSAESLAALGDFSAMGRLYGWTDEQIASAREQWLAAQYSGGSGGGGSSVREPVVFETYDNGMTDIKIANQAAKLFTQKRIAPNSAEMSRWLKSNGYTGNSAAKFKEYYSEMYNITGEKPNTVSNKANLLTQTVKKEYNK